MLRGLGEEEKDGTEEERMFGTGGRTTTGTRGVLKIQLVTLKLQ